MKRFKAKTGNIWGDDFIAQQQKYLIMDIVVPTVEEVVVDNVVAEDVLETAVKDFIEKISDRSLIKSTMSQFKIDSEKLPLGKISSNQIQKAMAVLKKIEEILKEDITQNQTIAVKSECLCLSSVFWTLIPYVHGRNKPPIIDTLTTIKMYVEFLGILDNLEVTSKVVFTTSTPSSIYKSLGLTISTNVSEEEQKMIERYVKCSHGHNHRYKLEVVRILKIADKYKDDMFDQHISTNLKLLFHGSRTANFVGILKQGLRVPVETQIVNGAALGFGIYFANSVSKSFNYTSTNNNDTGFVLLCDVNLGDNPEKMQNALFDIGPNKKYTSRIAQGQFGFSNDGYAQEERMVVAHPMSGFMYDEFAIFDESKYRFRYVVELKKTI